MEAIANALVALGCPPEKAGPMAAQLAKRATQLAAQKGRTEEEAVLHLLKLMKDSGGLSKAGDFP